MNAMANPTPLEKLRRELALAVGENAVFDGWARQAVDAAAGQLGLDPAQARLAMPKAQAAMIDTYIQEVDRGLEAWFTPERLSQLKIREKIRALIWLSQVRRLLWSPNGRLWCPCRRSMDGA